MMVKNFYFNKGEIEYSVFEDKLESFGNIMYDKEVVFFVNNDNAEVAHINKNGSNILEIEDAWDMYPEAFLIKSLYISNDVPKDINFMFDSKYKKPIAVSVHIKNEEHFICFSNDGYLNKINNKG